MKDFGLAHHCVPKSFLEEQPFLGNTLLAWIELEAGKEEDARVAAALALDSSAISATQQEISILARMLARLGEDDKALPLFEQAATRGVLDDDCKRLVDCAQRLDRHDILLRVCAELRQTNQQDNLTRRLEVQLLSNYALDQAFALAKESTRYDQSYFRAVSNFLAVRLDKLDQVQFDDANLPSPGDFETDEAYLVITPYIEVGRYRDALEYTYQQLRLRFSEEHAHGQYIWFVLTYGEKAAIPQCIEVVDAQSAVRLKNLMTGAERWVTIEDHQPDPARNEYSSSTSVAEGLIGTRMGDNVDLLGPSLQSQQERVVEIQSKYVRLFQDALSSFQQRFPGAGTIQSIHLGTAGDYDFSPVIESLEKRREHVRKVMDVYHQRPSTLHLLASSLGINERQLMIGLATRSEWFVRCVDCSPRQYSEVATAGFSTNKIVLDLSAIVTLSQLDVWGQIDEEAEFLVSRATSDRIAEWLHGLTETGSQPTAYSCLDDDGTVRFHEVSPEQLRNERDEVRKMAANVRALCTVKSSIELADLDPKRREEYIDVCGFESLESMSLARAEDALFWTDDFVVGVLAQVDFGVTRTWTQLMFKVLEDAGKCDGETYHQITAKLAAWNYITTVWDSQDVIAAGDLCDWDVSQWPLKECIHLVGTCPLPPPDRAHVAMDVLRLLRRSPCSELKQTPVVQGVLDSLGNSDAVEWMLKHLGQAFKYDPSSVEFLKVELLYWLRLR